jgi:hypothetical protein
MSSNVNRIRAVETCRNWNQAFKIGTEVIFDGTKLKTWSHAGLGPKNEACVFLDGVEEPIPITRLQVPGWETTRKKTRSDPNES